MGKGRFLLNMAKQHPDINFIGIERYSKVYSESSGKIRYRRVQELTNVRFVCMDAKELPEVFAKGEVGRIYLNFSDPWPKARHAKRRLTSTEFLARYDKILAEEGSLEFKTDNTELFPFFAGTDKRIWVESISLYI